MLFSLKVLFPFHSSQQQTLSPSFLDNFVLPKSLSDMRNLPLTTNQDVISDSTDFSHDNENSSTDDFSINPLTDVDIHSPLANVGVDCSINPLVSDNVPSVSNIPSTSEASVENIAPHSTNTGVSHVFEPCRSTRSRCPPNYLKDFHCNVLAYMPTNSSSPYSLQKYLSYNNCSDYEPTYNHQAISFSHR